MDVASDWVTQHSKILLRLSIDVSLSIDRHFKKKFPVMFMHAH